MVLTLVNIPGLNRLNAGRSGYYSQYPLVLKSSPLCSPSSSPFVALSTVQRFLICFRFPILSTISHENGTHIIKERQSAIHIDQMDFPSADTLVSTLWVRTRLLVPLALTLADSAHEDIPFLDDVSGSGSRGVTSLPTVDTPPPSYRRD